VAHDRRRQRAYLALAAAGALWGTGFPFGKIALASMSVGHMIFYRYLFAVLTLVPVAIQQRLALPRRTDLPRILVSGALYVPIQFLIQFEGVARTTVSHASLMVGALPILVAVGAVLFTHETLDRVGWLTLTASTIGAALIVSGGGSSGGRATMTGDLLVILSLFAAVGWVLTSKGLMRAEGGYTAVEASVYVMFAGTVMLGVWVFLVDGSPPLVLPPVAWGAVIASGVLATAATTLLWNWGLTRVPASRAGVFLNLEPVVGVIIGVAMLHERLGPVAIIGGALIIGSAILFTLRPVGES
jgi:drug/metabolite transporter (DMT)-like permease